MRGQTADRGGPFGLGHVRCNLLRARRSAAPQNAQRIELPAEPSPIGGDWLVGVRLLGIVALLVAAVALAQGGAIIAKATLGQWLLQNAWRQTRAHDTAVKPWPWADTYPVAKLSVPSLQVEMIALSGATGRTLAWGPGHLDGSARAGDPGNAVFTAHRDTHFAFLAHLKIGDHVIIERADRSRVTFRVAAMSVVAIGALHLRAKTNAPTLTLVTCYPFDAVAPNTRWRYVVSAVLEGPPLMAATPGNAAQPL